MLSQSWTGTAPLIFTQVAVLARSPAPVARVPVAIICCALLCRCAHMALSGSKRLFVVKSVYWDVLARGNKDVKDVY